MNNVHTENVEIECELCGEKFKNIKKHLNNVHTENVECDICRKKFKNRDS